MQKKRTGAMAVSIVLVIVAMVIGLVIGFMIGKSYREKDAKASDIETTLESEAETQTVVESDTQESQTEETETAAETETAQTEVKETEATIDSEGGTVVMQVGDAKVGMDVVNARRYNLRDYYIQNYGEEPWDVMLDSGMTVGEEAKEVLRGDLIRAEIFSDKAADYGIGITDDVRAMCEAEAQKRMEDLGEEVTREFGITKEALTDINIKFQLITAVTNALSDEFRTQMAEDPEYQGMDEMTLEQKIAEKVKAQEKEWISEYDISYSDVWDNIIVGSVG